MSLSGALQIGRSGLLAHQRAIEVTGNNLANLATPGYHKQVINLSPARTQEIQTGIHVGRGVQIESIVRRIDQALESRIRGSIADEQASIVKQDILTQIEALENELTDIDLSSHLSEFFNAWSNLSNQPLDSSLRSLLVQQSDALGSFVRNLRSEMVSLRNEVDGQIDQNTLAANDLLQHIETLNGQIAQAEGGVPGNAHALRDERDRRLAELSEYMDISTNELNTGVVDIFVGSLPIMLNGQSRGLEVRRDNIDDELQIDVVLKADGSVVDTSTGRIGALVTSREDDVMNAIDVLNDFANNLIFQVNKIHSQGQGTQGFNSLTGTELVDDATVALNDTATGLDFVPNHGSFQLHVTQTSTGQRDTSAIAIDLDGIGTDMSLNDLATAISGVANVTATVTPDGRLRIDSASGDFELSFSNDTSGVLAALGINTFFSGSDASDIQVNELVSENLQYVAAGLGHVQGDNSNAVAIAGLRDQGLSDLNGLSLTELWSGHVEEYAVKLGQTTAQAQTDGIVRQNLEAQQQSLSGVNPDEEAINLLNYQRAYQGSARFLTVVDQMLETLLGLV